jgi:hypothetical protein
VADARWRFGIGDPTSVGWLTVAAYAVAAALSIQAFRTARAAEQRLALTDPRASRDQRSMKQLWMLIAATMILLGIDRQLDLQTLLIQQVRDRAYANGWYSDRRRYQVDFIAAVSVIGVFVTIGLAIWLRRVFTRVALAIAGLAMLVSFVAIKAASFHYIDEALSFGKEFRVSAVIELSGIGLIIGAAMLWQQVERRDGRSRLDGVPSASDLSFPPPNIAERIS